MSIISVEQTPSAVTQKHCGDRFEVTRLSSAAIIPCRSDGAAHLLVTRALSHLKAPQEEGRAYATQLFRGHLKCTRLSGFEMRSKFRVAETLDPFSISMAP